MGTKGKGFYKSFEKPTLTKQSFKDECDVNKIVKRFRNVNGCDIESSQQGRFPGFYGDFTDVPDLREGIERVREAKELFEGLPKKCRDYFNNDYALFAQQSHTLSPQELIDLGLASPVGNVQKEVKNG